MTANDRLLRVAEAAELLNLSTYTTYEYARRGLIPSIRIGSGRVGRLRFPEAKLRAAIDQMRKASA